MRRSHYLLTALLPLLAAASATVAADSAAATDGAAEATGMEKKSWTLYHSVSVPGGSPSSLERRGRVLLTVETGSGAAKLAVENDPQALREGGVLHSNASSSAGWYRLVLVPDDEDDGDESRRNHRDNNGGVATTVPACQLRRANFRDEIVLMFGENGHVLSMSYQPLVSPLAPKSCDGLEPIESSAEFQSRISYETSAPGMSLRHVLAGEKPPPGLKYLPFPKRPQQGGAAGSNPLLQDGDGKNQQQTPDASPFGFMRRYWYILLPLMLLNILASPAQEQQQGDPAPSPRTAGAPVAGPVAPSRGPAAGGGANVAASSPSGGATKQRRGKRG